MNDLDTFGIGRFRCRGQLLKYRFAFPVGVPSHHASRWSHEDERDVRDELWLIEPGDTVFDLGSSFGSYSLTALAAGAKLVHCFNPHPGEQRLLAASMALNGWQGRFTQHLVGLYSEPGYLSDQDQQFVPNSSAEFQVGKTESGQYTQRFNVTTLDSLALEQPEGRSVLKCDIEGAEVEMLDGARSFFSRVAPELCLFEEHKFKDQSIPERLEEKMVALGYRLEKRRLFQSGEINHSLFVRSQ